MNPVEIRVPGDKSIAHRLLILASLAHGRSQIRGIPPSLDVRSTRDCLSALGAQFSDEPEGVIVEGPVQWVAPQAPLQCGNSGTTARLLTGLAVGLGVGAELRGDRSLSRRPMDRVVYPLQAMGARIDYTETPGRLPIRIGPRSSGDLRPLRYRPRVSSAQVRGAILLAAMTCGTDVTIIDRGRARDHTERLLTSLGAPVRSEDTSEGVQVELRASTWSGKLSPFDLVVPGDLSSAAFLIVAALLRGRSLVVREVGLNPTRTGFLDVLSVMGARITAEVEGHVAGEPVGSLRVEYADLGPFEVGTDLVPRLVDEIPALVALASRVPGRSFVSGASELRAKESDRLVLLAQNLKLLGAQCEEEPDGLQVVGSTVPLAGRVRTGGDHRISMAFAILGRAPGCRIDIDDRSCVDVSFPGFWEALDTVAPTAES